MAQTRSCFSPDKLVCVPQLPSRAFGIAIFLVASTSNLCIRIAQHCRPPQTQSPFEAWGCAPVDGRAAAPARQRGPSVSLTASQLRRIYFCRGSMTTRMLRFDEGVVSIPIVQGSGPPRRIAYGCTSHARPRNAFPTCMTRPHEFKLSCSGEDIRSLKCSGR